MKYHFKVHKEGNSKEELFENMKEALNLYLEEPEDSTFLIPFPKKNGILPLNILLNSIGAIREHF